MRIPARTIRLVLFLALQTPSIAQTTAPSLQDHTSPAAVYQTLLNAIDHDDLEMVAHSVLYPLALAGAEGRLMAERLVVGSKLTWAIADKFGDDASVRAHRYAELASVPRENIAALTFEVEQHPPAGIAAMMRVKDAPGRYFAMVRMHNDWKLDRSHQSIGELGVIIEDAPWRNAILHRVLDDLKAGKISDEDALHAALVPAITQMPTTTSPTDRSIPSNVPWAIQIAIESGDEAEVADCYTQLGVDPTNEIRSQAHLMVATRKLDRALHEKFGPAIGDRITATCGLKNNNITEYYANVKWAIDGEVARGIRDEYRLDSLMRMRRRAGKWRIELPPDRSADAIFPYERQHQQDIADLFASRRKKIDDVLDHLDKYSDPGSVLDVLDPARSEEASVDPKTQAAKEQARRDELAAQLKQQQAEFAANRASLSAQEEAETELSFSLIQGFYLSTGAPTVYFVQGDPDGAYLRARRHRLQATRALIHAVDREVSSDAEHLAFEFTLTDAADDPQAIAEIEWTFNGDTATGKPPEGVRSEPFWTPRLRKISNEWKVDLTDETDGNPAIAAARAETEAQAIERITAQVGALKFQTLDQVQAALKSANVRGTGKPM
jgi:hypothetical protein